MCKASAKLNIDFGESGSFVVNFSRRDVTTLRACTFQRVAASISL